MDLKKKTYILTLKAVSIKKKKKEEKQKKMIKQKLNSAI